MLSHDHLRSSLLRNLMAKVLYGHQCIDETPSSWIWHKSITRTSRSAWTMIYVAEVIYFGRPGGDVAVRPPGLAGQESLLSRLSSQISSGSIQELAVRQVSCVVRS
jgi:hypothetical protein